jgi:hypothetical protein
MQLNFKIEFPKSNILVYIKNGEHLHGMVHYRTQMYIFCLFIFLFVFHLKNKINIMSEIKVQSTSDIFCLCEINFNQEYFLMNNNDFR